MYNIYTLEQDINKYSQIIVYFKKTNDNQQISMGCAVKMKRMFKY